MQALAGIRQYQDWSPTACAGLRPDVYPACNLMITRAGSRRRVKKELLRTSCWMLYALTAKEVI
jgi:hypothetical protein